MRAIDLFPYWEDNRALLLELLASLKEEDLAHRPAPGLRSLGEVLRHIITTEEHWWRGGILGEPFEAWRPAGWERLTIQQKEAYRTKRFPSLATIREGLRAAHAPVVAFLCDLDAWALCERRRAAWGLQNSLRWILWHLVEHDQHHRAQVYARLRWLGYDPPPVFPRPAVMGHTPSGRWRLGDVEVRDVVPFWDTAHGVLREAVTSLSETDLAFRPALGFPSVHDLLLHIVTWEDFLIRQSLRGEVDRDWWRIDGRWWRVPVVRLAEEIGGWFPSAASVADALSAVHGATRSAVDALEISDLARTHDTPWGPQVWHHVLWYAREHTVHHRAQVFLRLRMLGRTPPDL